MAQPRAIGTRLSDVLNKVERDLEEVRDEFLRNMARDIVNGSPVWSGRYVTSHEISTNSAAGRFTGNLEPMTERTSVPQAYKSEGLANLMGDIAALPKDATRVYINNNAPHAQIVEYGGKTNPSAVYESAMNRSNLHLQEAINTVRGRQ